MHADLMDDGLMAGRDRISRMRDDNLKARQKRRFKKTTDSNHGGPVAPNHLDQDFDATAPDQKWADRLRIRRTQSQRGRTDPHAK